MKLTDEQRKQVEENHNLIYWYMHKNGMSDDNYDILALALCIAVTKYEPDKGSFSNYFVITAKGLLYKEYRKTLAKKRIPKETEYTDNVHSIANMDESLEFIEFKEWADKHDSVVLKMRMDGYSQVEIANHLGVSQAQVSRILQKLKKVYYNEINR